MKIVLRVIIPLIILFAIDLYAFQAVKTVTSGLGQNQKKWVAIIYWSIPVLLLDLFIAGMLSDFYSWPKFIRTYVTGIVMVIYVAKLILVLFLLVDDLGRLARWVISFFSNPKEPIAPEHPTISRSLFISQAALVVAAIPSVALIYGMIYGAFDYKVRRLKIAFANLPKSFHGLKILQLSDIHSGSFTDGTHLQKAVDMVMAEKADIVLFTGDLVNNITDEVYPFMDILKQIKAPMGVYSSLGNHDYGDYASWPTEDAKKDNMHRFYTVHKDLGWDLLRNENRIFTRDSEKIAIAGVENWGSSMRFPKYGDLNKASKGLSDIPFTLLMSHDPSHWDAQILAHQHKFDITLAGHTHGAQFGVDTKLIKWSPIQYVYKQWAGLYKKGEKYIYVNRGLGFLGYPGRAGIRPEITVITLESKA